MPRQIVGRISSILPSLNLPLRTIATGAHKRPCRCIYSGSRGQINSGVHVVKSVVTTTREHQPLSERLVTERRWRRPRTPSSERQASLAAPGIHQVDLLKIVVRSRYAPRYISPVVCRVAGIGARLLQAASRRTRCASSTSACRHEIRQTHAALLKHRPSISADHLFRYLYRSLRNEDFQDGIRGSNRFLKLKISWQ